MKTPNKYNKNINNKIITKEMLYECLISMRIRINNCNKKLEYKGPDIIIEWINQYQENKKIYCKNRDILLALLKPTCIHCLPIKINKGIDEYDAEWNNDKLIKHGIYKFYDFVKEEHIQRGYVYTFIPSYYLCYDLGEHAYEVKIDESNLEEYSNLEIKDITKLDTRGEDLENYISPSFVNKVVEIIEKGDYQLID